MNSGKQVLITGSAGLIGSESAKFFANLGFTIHGIDNNMREYFFGKEASTEWSKKQLEQNLKDKYIHHQMDIRDNDKLEEVFKKTKFDLIILEHFALRIQTENSEVYGFQL